MRKYIILVNKSCISWARLFIELFHVVCFGCLCFIIFVLFFSLQLSELILFILKSRYFNRNKITVSVGKLTFASFEVSLKGAGAILLRMYISVRSLCACPACFGWQSSTPSNPVALRVSNLSGYLWIILQLCDEKVRKRYRCV